MTKTYKLKDGRMATIEQADIDYLRSGWYEYLENHSETLEDDMAIWFSGEQYLISEMKQLAKKVKPRKKKAAPKAEENANE